MDAATLASLRRGGLAAASTSDLATALRAAGGQELRAVYQLTEEELVNDRYGFAREFVLSLREGVGVEAARHTLESSPLIRSAEPLLLREALR